MEEETIFEKIIRGDIKSDVLLENNDAIVINDINPQAPVHVLIIPKKKITKISTATSDSGTTLGKLLLTAKKFAEIAHLSSFRLVINDGTQAGQTVNYLHIHLLSGRPMKWPPG